MGAVRVIRSVRSVLGDHRKYSGPTPHPRSALAQGRDEATCTGLGLSVAAASARDPPARVVVERIAYQCLSAIGHKAGLCVLGGVARSYIVGLVGLGLGLHEWEA